MDTKQSGGGLGSRRKAPRGLIVLNLVLLGGLGLVSIAPGAWAQSGNSITGSSAMKSRVPGEYSVVGGATIGGVSSMLYVLDTANGELIALSWNDSTKSVDGIGYRDLSVDAKSEPDR